MEPVARDNTAVCVFRDYWGAQVVARFHLACCSIWPAVPFGLGPMTRDGKTTVETNVSFV